MHFFPARRLKKIVLNELSKRKNKVGKEKCREIRENKVKESNVSEKKYVTFTKKGNDSTIMERTKMAK